MKKKIKFVESVIFLFVIILSWNKKTENLHTYRYLKQSLPLF